MSTPAENAINGLLLNAEFNTLVASLKSKRDEIASYQYQITNYTENLASAQSNLTAAQAQELTLQQQVQTTGAVIIASLLH